MRSCFFGQTDHFMTPLESSTPSKSFLSTVCSCCSFFASSVVVICAETAIKKARGIGQRVRERIVPWRTPHFALKQRTYLLLLIGCSSTQQRPAPLILTPSSTTRARLDALIPALSASLLPRCRQVVSAGEWQRASRWLGSSAVIGMNGNLADRKMLPSDRTLSCDKTPDVDGRCVWAVWFIWPLVCLH